MYYIYGIEHKLEGCFPLWIGMTDNPERRFKQHLITNISLIEELKRMCEKRMCDKNNTQLVNYGAEQFILAQTEDKDEARELERYYINLLYPIFNIRDNEDGIKAHRRIKTLLAIRALMKKNLFSDEISPELHNKICAVSSKIIDIVQEGLSQ